MNNKIKIIKGIMALAGVAQWIEHQTANQRVKGLIPSQGMCLGCGTGPQQGERERQPHIDGCLPPFPSLRINIIFFLNLMFKNLSLNAKEAIIFIYLDIA